MKNVVHKIPWIVFTITLLLFFGGMYHNYRFETLKPDSYSIHDRDDAVLYVTLSIFSMPVTFLILLGYYLKFRAKLYLWTTIVLSPFFLFSVYALWKIFSIYLSYSIV